MSQWITTSHQQYRCPVLQVKQEQDGLRITFKSADDVAWYQRNLASDGMPPALVVPGDPRSVILPAGTWLAAQLEELRFPASFALPTDIFLAASKSADTPLRAWEFKPEGDGLTGLVLLPSPTRKCVDFCLTFSADNIEREFRVRAWDKLKYVRQRTTLCQDIRNSDDEPSYAFIRGNYLTHPEKKPGEVLGLLRAEFGLPALAVKDIEAVVAQFSQLKR